MYLKLDNENILITHAFLPSNTTLGFAIDLGDTVFSPNAENTIIWSRFDPTPHDKYRLQLCGHNGYFREFTDHNGKVFAICLDDSQSRVLTGMHLKPSGQYQFFKQPYIE